MGLAIPDAAELPSLWESARPYYDAFDQLAPSRQMALGMGGALPLPLRYDDASRYAHDHGFAESSADLQEFWLFLRVQDEVVLAHEAKRQASKPPSPSSPRR